MGKNDDNKNGKNGNKSYLGGSGKIIKDFITIKANNTKSNISKAASTIKGALTKKTGKSPLGGSGKIIKDYVTATLKKPVDLKAKSKGVAGKPLNKLGLAKKVPGFMASTVKSTVKSAPSKVYNAITAVPSKARKGFAAMDSTARNLVSKTKSTMVSGASKTGNGIKALSDFITGNKKVAGRVIATDPNNPILQAFQSSSNPIMEALDGILENVNRGASRQNIKHNLSATISVQPGNTSTSSLGVVANSNPKPLGVDQVNFKVLEDQMKKVFADLQKTKPGLRFEKVGNDTSRPIKITKDDFNNGVAKFQIVGGAPSYNVLRRFEIKLQDKITYDLGRTNKSVQSINESQNSTVKRLRNNFQKLANLQRGQSSNEIMRNIVQDIALIKDPNSNRELMKLANRAQASVSQVQPVYDMYNKLGDLVKDISKKSVDEKAVETILLTTLQSLPNTMSQRQADDIAIECNRIKAAFKEYNQGKSSMSSKSRNAMLVMAVVGVACVALAACLMSPKFANAVMGGLNSPKLSRMPGIDKAKSAFTTVISCAQRIPAGAAKVAAISGLSAAAGCATGALAKTRSLNNTDYLLTEKLMNDLQPKGQFK